MGYDRGDSFPFDFEPNGIPFGSKLKGKLSPRSYPIQFERKCKYNFLSVIRSLEIRSFEIHADVDSDDSSFTGFNFKPSFSILGNITPIGYTSFDFNVLIQLRIAVSVIVNFRNSSFVEDTPS